MSPPRSILPVEAPTERNAALRLPVALDKAKPVCTLIMCEQIVA